MKTIPLTRRPDWQALENHYQAIKDIYLRNLFDEDSRRGERLSVQSAGRCAARAEIANKRQVERFIGLET